MDFSIRAIRHLQKRLFAAPWITVSSLLVIAIGMGVTTAGYASIRALWLRPPDVPLLNRVVEVRSSPNDPLISWPDYEDLRSMATAFDHIAGFVPFPGSAVAQGSSRNVVVEAVTEDYFSVLGLSPSRGRLLQPQDNDKGAAPAVAISERLWKRLYDEDPSAVTGIIQINDSPFTVVGVVPHEYRGGMVASWTQPTDVWVPLSALDNMAGLKNLVARAERDRRRIRIKALMSNGRTLQETATDIRRLAAVLDTSAPLRSGGKSEERRWAIVRMADAGPVENPAIRSLATTYLIGLTLLMSIIAVTVSSLMTARSDSERTSVAIRSMLGASRAQLMWAALADCILLVLLGGAVGMWLGHVLMSVTAGEIPIRANMTAVFEPSFDVAVLAMAGTLSFVLFLAASIPGFVAIRSSCRAGLTGQTYRISPKWRGRRWLIGGQVVAAVLLAMLSITATRQAMLMATQDVGYDLDKLAIAVTRNPPMRDSSRIQEAVSRIVRETSLNRNFAKVAISSGVPGAPEAPAAYIRVAGQRDPASAALLASSPEIFETLGISLVRGRLFNSHDSKTSERVMVIDRVMADRVFSGVNPIGTQVEFRRQASAGGPKFEPEQVTIIGIVDDGHARRPSVYVPLEQHELTELWVIGRAATSASSLVEPLRLSSARSSELTVAAVDTGLRLIKPEQAFQDLTAMLTAAIAVFTFLVAVMGLYGLLTHAVLSREREIGIRLALGSTGGAVVRSIVREGMTPVILAVVIGIGVGLIARMATRPVFLKFVPTIDAIAVLIVPIAVIAISSVACYLPARRAAYIDPNRTLKNS